MSTNKIEHAFTPDSGVVVGIVGLGYVGLPTAIGFHASGFEVWGCDKSAKVIDALKSGLNPVGDHELDSMIPHRRHLVGISRVLSRRLLHYAM